MLQPHAPSYYAASANPFPAQPRLAGEEQADVVVVGGGFTGLSAALHAAEAGYSVVLLEAQRIGWGASGRSGGQMIPGLRWGLDELISELDRDGAEEQIEVPAQGDSRIRRFHRCAPQC